MCSFKGVALESSWIASLRFIATLANSFQECWYCSSQQGQPAICQLPTAFFIFSTSILCRFCYVSQKSYDWSRAHCVAVRISSFQAPLSQMLAMRTTLKTPEAGDVL